MARVSKIDRRASPKHIRARAEYIAALEKSGVKVVRPRLDKKFSGLGTTVVWIDEESPCAKKVVRRDK